MKRPSIQYLVASPAGDIPVDTRELDYLLEGDPLGTTYRIYFSSITEFLLKGNLQPLLQAVNERLGADFDLEELSEIIIRTEKHGALYHPASIECLLRDSRVKFALLVAVTDTGKESLRKEFMVLKMLQSRVSLTYLPSPYYLTELQSMVFLIEEWFDDFHEFHLTKTVDGRQQMKLWEYGRGERLLTTKESFEIYRQAAEILTLYFDFNDFRLIYPWHHAAGDFVARIFPDNRVDVRLTTVRAYEPFLRFDENEMPQPILSLFYFLLHLTIQMRLDRIDGIGDVVWAEDCCIDATLTGFFQALERKNEFKECCGSLTSFQMLLKSFTKEELRKTIIRIAEQFEQTTDYPVIQEHLRDHSDRLQITLQNFP